MADLDSHVDAALDLAMYARLSARLAMPFSNAHKVFENAGVSAAEFERARAAHRREISESRAAQEAFAAAFRSEARAMKGEPEPEKVEEASIQETAIARAPTPEELLALPFGAGRYTPKKRDVLPEDIDPDGDTLPFLSDAIRAPLPFIAPTKKDPSR